MTSCTPAAVVPASSTSVSPAMHQAWVRTYFGGVLPNTTRIREQRYAAFAQSLSPSAKDAKGLYELHFKDSVSVTALQQLVRRGLPAEQKAVA